MKTKNKKSGPVFVIIIASLLFACSSKAQTEVINPEQAAAFFKEAKEITTKDNGKIWGLSLYGPMMFVDPATRQVVANEEGNGLKKEDDVY